MLARLALGLTLSTLPITVAAAQNPRPVAPIDTSKPVIVNVAEFASIPDVNGQAARMMHLTDEPGTKRLFVSDMRGPLYSVSYDGKTVTLYVDVNDSTWGVHVQSQGRERGVQSFAFHPQFAQRGAPGYGKFYTWADSRNTQAQADFVPPSGDGNTHHTVLHEWTAKDAAAATYDGGAPRELFRFRQPYSNHNGGMAAFNPLARSGSPDFGLLYIGNGDGGSGGDPLNAAQDLTNGFGKILRIDPMGRNSRNGKYGIPASNPFADGKTANALPEIFAYGLRNPQRFAWDSKNGNMFVSDIGQGMVEEVDVVKAGDNLGWNTWEGSFKYVGRQGVDATNSRSDEKVVFPLVEYAHGDPVISNRAAISGLHVFRGNAVPPLQNKVVFSDLPSGEILFFDADNLPRGGSEGIGRVLLKQGDGAPKKLLQLTQEQNAKQGKTPTTRTDTRLSGAADGRVFIINKADGIIRVITK
jgi:hypothetical protein